MLRTGVLRGCREKGIRMLHSSGCGTLTSPPLPRSEEEDAPLSEPSQDEQGGEEDASEEVRLECGDAGTVTSFLY